MHPDLSPVMRILLVLENGPASAKEIADRGGLASVYKYLSILRATGLVRSPRRGVYELTGAGREELERRRRELCRVLGCGGEENEH